MSPGLEVRVGFGGMVKLGVPVPLHTVISPPLPSGRAELIVEAPALGPQAGRVVLSSVVPFQAVAGASRVFDIPIVINDPRHPVAVIVSVDGREILRRAIPIAPEQVGERLLVALSDDRAGPASFRRPSGIVVAYVDGNALPRRWQEYAAVDLLVIRDVDPAAVDRVQQDALLTWVRLGGRLLLIARPESRFLPMLDSVLPAAPGGARAVASLSALTARFGGVFPPGPHPIVALRPRPGTRILAQSGLPIIVAGNAGAGKVTIWAFDPWLPPYLAWSGRVRLWEETLGAKAAAGLDPGALVEQLPLGTPLDPLAHTEVGVAIALYIVVLLSFLRWRRTIAGAAGGLLIAMLGVAAFVLLADTVRDRSATLAEATVLELAAGSDTARATTVAAVAVPYGGRYRVTASHEMFATPVAPAGDLTVELTANATVLTGLLRSGAPPRALQAVGAAPVGASAWWSAGGRRLDLALGTLRLRAAELRWHDRLVPLGELPPGRSVREIPADAWAAAAGDDKTLSEFSAHLRDAIFRGPTGDAILNGAAPVLLGELRWAAPVFLLDDARAPGQRLTILLMPLSRR
jgi:hypothetical protein